MDFAIRERDQLSTIPTVNIERPTGDEGGDGCKGAGMSAAVGAGWYDNFHEAKNAMARTTEALAPDPATYEDWLALSQRQAQIRINDRG